MCHIHTEIFTYKFYTQALHICIVRRRYSDAIVGIQWLLDAGQGATADTAFLWDLMRLIRTQSDGVMAAVSEADGGGYRLVSRFIHWNGYIVVGCHCQLLMSSLKMADQ